MNFETIKRIYATTPPVREHGAGTKYDLRPVADRRKKWERVAKISDNCYSIFCGWTPGDPIYNRMWLDHSCLSPRDTWLAHISKREMAALAPVTFRRHRDGTETVTIRNGWNAWATSHTRLLNEWTPWNVHITPHKGQLFALVNGQRYSLRHSSTYPAGIHKLRAAGTLAGYYARQFDAGDISTAPDGSALTFRLDRNDAGVAVATPINLTKKHTHHYCMRVDKRAKAQCADHIAEFTRMVLGLGPMLGRHYYYDDPDGTAERLVERYLGKVASHHSYWFRSGSRDYVVRRAWQDVLRSGVREDLMPSVRAAWSVIATPALQGYERTSTGWKVVETPPSEKLMRARLNAFINKRFNFCRPVEVPN